MVVIRGFPSINLNFPENLDQLHYTGQHIYGGSGGVYILEDEQKNRFVLKIAQEESIFKDEIVTDGLYRSLSVPVPDFAVYNEIPPQLAAQIGCKEHVLCRLTPFLENQLDNQPNELVNKGIADYFVTDAFFSNSDLHIKNLIFNNNILYRIDNGASIRFYALGRAKIDNQLVKEIDLFRDDSISVAAGTAYKTLSKTAIQQQVDQLISKSDTLLESYLLLHQALALNSPSFFEKILISRLSYLMEHYASELHTFPNRYAFAVPDYSSSSTFLIKKNQQGEYCILVGKRVKHDYWSDFGGASEVYDTLLEQTALRELHEETNGLIKNQVPTLHHIIFHDQIKEGKKHRTYFVKLDSDEALDNKLKTSLTEHTEGLWLPINSILNALSENTIISCEDKKTIAVLDAEKKKIALFPPMNAALHDPIMMSHLTSIAQGKWPTKSTINRISSDYPLRLTNKINSHKFNQKFHPAIVSEHYAKTMQNKEKMLDSLRKREDKAETPDTLSEPKSGSSVSEFQLNLALTEDEKKLPLKSRIRAVLGQNTWQLKYTDADIEQLNKMIAQEANHPESAPLYHATQPEMVFLNRVFSVFRYKLDAVAKKNHLFFRPLDVAFADGLSMQQFQDEQKARFKKVNYYNPGYSERVLSVNYHLFGNYFVEENKTSCSTYYFLNNYESNPPEFDQYLTYLLSMLGIQETATQVKHCFQLTYSQIGSCMLQIFLNKEIADQVLYPAGANGIPNPLVVDTNQETTYKRLSEKVLFSDQQQKYLNKLRGGLYLLPEVMHSTNVAVHEYHRQVLPDNANKLIDDLASTLVYHFIRKNNQFSGMSFAKKPLILKHFESLKQVEPYSLLDDEMDIDSLIANTIFRNEATPLESLLAYCPEFSLTMSVKNPDYMKNNQVNVIVIDLLINAKKDMLKVIFTHLKNHNQFFSALRIKTKERNSTFLDLLIQQKMNDEVFDVLDLINDIKRSELRALLKTALVYGNEAMYTYLIRKYNITKFKSLLTDTYHDLGIVAYPVFIGAIVENSLQSVKFLHDKGAKLTSIYTLTKAQDSFLFPKKFDAMSVALLKGNQEIINYLLLHVTEQLALDASDRNERNAYAPWLAWAIFSGKVEIVQCVLDYYKKNNIDVKSRLYQKFNIYKGMTDWPTETQAIKLIKEGNNTKLINLLLPYVDHRKDKNNQLFFEAEINHNTLYLNHFYENMPDKKVGKTIAILLDPNFICNDIYYDKLAFILLDTASNLTTTDKKQQVLDYFAKNSKFFHGVLEHVFKPHEKQPAGMSLIGECLYHVKQELDKNSLLNFFSLSAMSNNVKLTDHFLTQIIQGNRLIKQPEKLLTHAFGFLLRGSYPKIDAEDEHEDKMVFSAEMQSFFKEKLLHFITLPIPGKDLSIIDCFVGGLLLGKESTNIPALQCMIDLLKQIPDIDVNICLLNAYYKCAFNQKYEHMMFIESSLAQRGVLTDTVIKTAFYCVQLQWNNRNVATLQLCEHFMTKIFNFEDYLTFDSAVCAEQIDKVTLDERDELGGMIKESSIMEQYNADTDLSKQIAPGRMLHLLSAILAVADDKTCFAQFHTMIHQVVCNTLNAAVSWQLKPERLEIILDVLRKILLTGNQKELFARYMEFKHYNHLPLVKDDILAMIRFDDFDLYKQYYQQAIALISVKDTLSLLINTSKLEFYNHQDSVLKTMMPQQNKLLVVVEAKVNAFITHLFEHEKISNELALKCLLDAARQNKAEVFNLIFDKLKTVPNDLLKTLLSDYEINQAYIYKILLKTSMIDIGILQTALERGNNRLAADIYSKAVELGNHLELSYGALHCLSEFIAVGNLSAETKVSIQM